MRLDATDLQRIFADTLGELTARLDAEHIPYMVIGGIAVGLHTAARATKDVDFSILAPASRCRTKPALHFRRCVPALR
jgi:hypothetical protein